MCYPCSWTWKNDVFYWNYHGYIIPPWYNQTTNSMNAIAHTIEKLDSELMYNVGEKKMELNDEKYISYVHVYFICNKPKIAMVLGTGGGGGYSSWVLA